MNVPTSIVITVPTQRWDAAQLALARAGLSLRKVSTAPGQAPRYELVDGTPPAGIILPPRERQALDYMALGLSNAGIGRKLGVSEDTAKTHVRRLFRRLGAASRPNAIHLAHLAGLLGDER